MIKGKIIILIRCHSFLIFDKMFEIFKSSITFCEKYDMIRLKLCNKIIAGINAFLIQKYNKL